MSGIEAKETRSLCASVGEQLEAQTESSDEAIDTKRVQHGRKVRYAAAAAVAAVLVASAVFLGRRAGAGASPEVAGGNAVSLSSADGSWHPGWKLISSDKACESNNDGITRTSGTAGVADIDSCRASCTTPCVAIDYDAMSQWCNLYAEACTTPTHEGGAWSSWVKLGGPTATSTTTRTSTSTATSTTTRTSTATSTTTKTATATSTTTKTSTATATSTTTRTSTATTTSTATLPARWQVISLDKACEDNTEGIARTGHSIQPDLVACANSCNGGCKAIDYDHMSSWCNTYNEACTNPQRDGGKWVSYKAQ